MGDVASELITRSEHKPWSVWGRVVFRFGFIFWGVIFWQLNGVGLLLWPAPRLERWLTWPVDSPVEWMSRWVGVHLFRLAPAAMIWRRTGSGDQVVAYVQAFTVLAIALIGAVLWSAISEVRAKRHEYQMLYAWLRLAIRFLLAEELLVYGFSKLFDLQFSPPNTWRLAETYGASSPMGLLWTFMGFSIPYTIFAGVMEVVPGVLLLFRRTSTAGALGAAIVMFNVVMLNFCYDVPVKLFSTELLLMAVFLLLPDMTPLWRLLVLRKPASVTGVWLPRWERKPLRITAYCLQGFVIAHLLCGTVSSTFAQWMRIGGSAYAAQTSGMDGRWKVDSSGGWPAGEEWKTLQAGTMRIESVDYLVVVKGSGERQDFAEATDVEHNVHFLGKTGCDLRWAELGPGRLRLDGTWNGMPATLTMHRVQDTFPLMTRGFHWVQGSPYNR